MIKDSEQLTLLLKNHSHTQNFFATLEKIGGLLALDSEHEDFENCISSCDLAKIQFKGSRFTWWNDGYGNDCIFERLDSVITNKGLQG
ncbi:hypothetical protein H5410_036705 [Solanum commersonii]|uniref:Uncharacterized protein n=1 Tax=Solanum commersonii TaxID=4109 RepID=A0A9J5Y513_SOLCO|nr:hypothetical protein H5410_036705 [Solanum commersonii]